MPCTISSCAKVALNMKVRSGSIARMGAAGLMTRLVVPQSAVSQVGSCQFPTGSGVVFVPRCGKLSSVKWSGGLCVAGMSGLLAVVLADLVHMFDEVGCCGWPGDGVAAVRGWYRRVVGDLGLGRLMGMFARYF